MSPSHEEQLSVCEEKFKTLEKRVDRHDTTFERLWEKVSAIDKRVAVLSAIGGIVGGYLGKHF